MLANKKRTICRAIFPVLFVLLFTGCGGGGGGDAPPQELVYSGNTNSAVITLENATTLVGNVLYGGDAGTNIPLAVMLTEETNPRSAGAVVQSKLLHNISQSIQNSIFENNTSLPDMVVGVELNEPLECDSGSGNIAGTLNDSTFTGTLTVTYSNCLLDDVTYNGIGTFKIDTFDLNYIEITDATITFTLLSISSPDFTGSMSGTIRIQSMIVSNTEKMTLNYVSKDNLTGKMYKFENMIITIVYDEYFYPTSMIETVTGAPARAYDSIHGYVDVDTITPLVYSSIMLENPDIDGVILFKGASGSSIRITVLSGELIQLELDIDGILGYEISRILLWYELNIKADTNIADTDNDGMHDSWELDNGFDPQDAVDANQDTDSDGSTNLREYLAGTDPNNPLSRPPPIPPVTLTLQTSDIIYDPVSGKIYASIPAQASTGANSVAIINPITGQVEATIPIGNDPGPLAVSDDGQFLYVGLNGSATVRQFVIASQTAGLEFSLGSDSFFGPYYAEDIEVLPGVPSSIAVSRKYIGLSPRHAGVGIYDNGVARTIATAGHTGSNVIEFDSSAVTLYGYNNESTEFGFRTMSVDSTGVTILDVTQNLIDRFYADIEYSDGRIYSTNARVINPITKTLIGTFNIGSSTSLVEPDSAVGRVFFLTEGVLNNVRILQAFDVSSLSFIDSMEISNVNGDPTSLIRWGSHGLAFRTSQNQVILIETTLVQKL